jgi:hypothetical protein
VAFKGYSAACSRATALGQNPDRIVQTQGNDRCNPGVSGFPDSQCYLKSVLYDYSAAPKIPSIGDIWRIIHSAQDAKRRYSE